MGLLTLSSTHKTHLFRYNVIYVFPRKYEGGGLIWSTVRATKAATCHFAHLQQIVAIIFVALLIYQLMMSGIYLLYKFESGGFALALPIITIFYWRYLHVKFYRRYALAFDLFLGITSLRSRYLALELCPTEADDTGRDREQYWCVTSLLAPAPHPAQVRGIQAAGAAAARNVHTRRARRLLCGAVQPARKDRECG